MSTLQDFLNSNPIDDLTHDVPISDRFKDKNGKLLKFKIKVMDSDQYEEYRKKALTINVKQKKADLNLQKLNSLMVINHTIEPNFKDAESIKKVGCATPEQYLNKVLLPGEIQDLASEIQTLSGFNKDIGELVEEAKN